MQERAANRAGMALDQHRCKFYRHFYSIDYKYDYHQLMKLDDFHGIALRVKTVPQN
jgi:hypothetical protein